MSARAIDQVPVPDWVTVAPERPTAVNAVSAPVKSGRADAVTTALADVPAVVTSAAAAGAALRAVRTWVMLETPVSICTLIALPVTVTTSAPAVAPGVKAIVMVFPADPIKTAVRVRPWVTLVAKTPVEPDWVTFPMRRIG